MGAFLKSIFFAAICASLFSSRLAFAEYVAPVMGTSGQYQINLASNRAKCVDITNVSKDSFALSQIYDCLGPNQLNQLYQVIPVTGSYGSGYQLVSVNSQKCLDVRNADTSNGALVQQYDCLGNEQKNQIWKFIAVGGAYQIQSVQSQKCLDLQAGIPSNENPIQIYDCYAGDTNPNQIWALTLVKAPSDLTYEINFGSDLAKCVDVREVSQDNGAIAQLYDCLGAGQANQIFTLKPVSGSFGNGYQLVANHSKRCLDVQAMRTEDGTPIQQWDCLDNQPNQIFTFYPFNNGYQIRSLQSQKCLDLSGGNLANTTPLNLYSCWSDGSNQNQIWQIQSMQSSASNPVDAATCLSGHKCYYLDSNAGNDLYNGTSSTTPWRTLDRANGASLNPGDFVYLKANSVFDHQLFGIHTSGSPGNPITITSYGAGALPIIQNNSVGIIGYSVTNVTISNLHISNISSAGIAAYGPSDNWTVSGCVIDNFAYSGIVFVPANQVSTFGVVITGNTIGRSTHSYEIDYGSAGILLHGTSKALVSRNSISTVSTYAVFIDNDNGQPSTVSDQNTVSYNDIWNNNAGIEIWNSSNAIVTHNKIHDGFGFGIGIDGLTTGTQFSSGALVTYNTIQNLQASQDSNHGLYNGIDINGNATNGRMFHNTVENVFHHSATFEGDGELPSIGWIVKNNIFDQRRAPENSAHNEVFFNHVEPYQETLTNNLFLGYLGTPYNIGSTLGLPAYEPGLLTQTEITNYGLANFSLFNLDPQFNNVAGEDLSIPSSSLAVGHGESISGIGQYNLDLGALPSGRTSVLDF